MVVPDEGNVMVNGQLQEEPSSESIEESATEEDSDADDPNDRFHVRTGVRREAAGLLQAVIRFASAASISGGEALHLPTQQGIHMPNLLMLIVK